MPVLRAPFSDAATEPRSRHPPQPGGPDELGEHRLRLPALQRPQRGPYAARGRDASVPPAGETQAQPDAGTSALEREVCVVEAVPRRGVLDRRIAELIAVADGTGYAKIQD